MSLEWKDCYQEKPNNFPVLVRLHTGRYAVVEEFDEQRYISRGWENCSSCDARSLCTCNPELVNSYTPLITQWANFL